VGIRNHPLRVDSLNAESSRTRGNRSVASSAGGVFRGSKRNCADRARWRLVRGQPAQHLSAHYRLDCDFGTATIAIYNDGDPVFLCESHVSAISDPRDNCIAGVRPIDANPAANDEPIGSADAAQPVKPVEEASIAPVPPKNDNHSEEVDEQREAPQHVGSVPDFCEVPANGAKPAEDKQAQSAQPIVSTPAASASAERLEAPKPKRAIAIPFVKKPVRDPAFGNAAKALVDETIWNMAPGDYEAFRAALQQGRTALEAAQAAGGQLAVVHRKIAEYATKIEAILSASKATISVGEAVDRPLDQAILEIIGSAAMGEAEKDAAVDHLGALQQKIKNGLDREMSALQAHQLARDIAECANWGGRSTLPEEVKPAYRAVYGSIREAIRTAVPEARELDERLSNLYAAKSDLENVPATKTLHSVAM
jgi:hypothetical protein